MSAEPAAILTVALLATTVLITFVLQIVECGSIHIWMVTWLFRCFCGFRLSQRVHGRCPLPISGGALLVANHLSPIDPMMIHSASLLKEGGYRTRVIGFLTASEYCDLGGPMAWVTKTAECIPVDRDGRDMGPVKVALRRLKAGRVVGIFPEGGIHQGPGLGKFDTGGAWLALRGNVPVIPALVRNTPYRDPIMDSFLARQPADVVFGPPIDLSRWDGVRPTAAVLHEVAAYLRDIIGQMKETAPPLPVDWQIAVAQKRKCDVPHAAE